MWAFNSLIVLSLLFYLSVDNKIRNRKVEEKLVAKGTSETKSGLEFSNDKIINHNHLDRI